MTRTSLHFNLLVVLFTGFFLNTRPTHPIVEAEDAPSDFARFSQSVQDGEAGVLRGVYVENVLALPVVQQPANDPYYVSSNDGEVTQFSMVSQYGNLGLLAHDTLAGRFFSNLAIGQEVRLVYGDGKIDYFTVEQILRFQALDPDSITSSFRNLDRNEVLSAGGMFNRAYVGSHRLVFQTCIDANGNSSWGRLFVVAVPKE